MLKCHLGKSADARRECVGILNLSSRSLVPTIHVSVGDVVTAHVHYKVEHHDVIFILCDDSSCSAHTIAGSAPSGALEAISDVRCNREGWWDCITNSEVSLSLFMVVTYRGKQKKKVTVPFTV